MYYLLYLFDISLVYLPCKVMVDSWKSLNNDLQYNIYIKNVITLYICSIPGSRSFRALSWTNCRCNTTMSSSSGRRRTTVCSSDGTFCSFLTGNHCNWSYRPWHRVLGVIGARRSQCDASGPGTPTWWGGIS